MRGGWFNWTFVIERVKFKLFLDFWIIEMVITICYIWIKGLIYLIFLPIQKWDTYGMVKFHPWKSYVIIVKLIRKKVRIQGL